MTLTAEPASAASGPRERRIALLRADAELREAVPERERPLAVRALIVPGYRLEAGTWDPESVWCDGRRRCEVLLVDGLMALEVGLAGRTTSYLRGPGEPLRPWDPFSHTLPLPMRWTASESGATIALLDDRFSRAERRWPNLGVVLRDRYAEQADFAALTTAIVGLPRVEQRVLALFWSLADRWGTARPDGVFVPLTFTHELLGRLVGAKRPTISLALAALTADGALRSAPCGGWLVSHESLALLGDGHLDPARTAPSVVPGKQFAPSVRSYERPA